MQMQIWTLEEGQWKKENFGRFSVVRPERPLFASIIEALVVIERPEKFWIVFSRREEAIIRRCAKPFVGGDDLGMRLFLGAVANINDMRALAAVFVSENPLGRAGDPQRLALLVGARV